MKILFNLPSRGGGGGAHSVVQETCGLRKIGIHVDIAINVETSGAFGATYPDLHLHGVMLKVYRDVSELVELSNDYDVVIGTTAVSAAEMFKGFGPKTTTGPKIGYYIQDYEPLFYKPSSDEWKLARSSYDSMPDALLFAKTDWLCDTVRRNHNRDVAKVQPSLDHSIYYPDLGRNRGKPLRICAMLRPSTMRRAPRRTVRILENIKSEYRDAVHVVAFGSSETELSKFGLKVSSDVENVGTLSRVQVASLLRGSDLFLDLSDYQAFGRTGLEAMACGCVPVLPSFGGTDEYALNRVNSYLVDTRSDLEILDAVAECMANKYETNQSMRISALETGARYSIQAACLSEYLVITKFFGL